MLSFSVVLLAAMVLLGASGTRRGDDLWFSCVALAYFWCTAALSMWMVIAEAWGNSAKGNDMLACVAIGLCAVSFPFVVASERGRMRWRLSDTPDKLQKERDADFKEFGVRDQAPRSALVRYSLPGNFIIAWSLCQVYVSMKYFLDVERLAADFVFVALLPAAASLFVTRQLDFDYWLHLRILCELARWLAFCFFPAIATGGMNASAYPALFVYSSWARSQSAYAYEGPLYFVAVGIALYVPLMYFVPSRWGESRLLAWYRGVEGQVAQDVLDRVAPGGFDPEAGPRRSARLQQAANEQPLLTPRKPPSVSNGTGQISRRRQGL